MSTDIGYPMVGIQIDVQPAEISNILVKVAAADRNIRRIPEGNLGRGKYTRYVGLMSAEVKSCDRDNVAPHAVAHQMYRLGVAIRKNLGENLGEMVSLLVNSWGHFGKRSGGLGEPIPGQDVDIVDLIVEPLVDFSGNLQ
jgi:hypothetical protein